MADTVTSQLIENGPKRVVYKFTNVTDGTGETGVIKVNATSSGPLGVVVQGQTIYPTTHLIITAVTFNVTGGGVRIQWEATANVDALMLTGMGMWRFKELNGFQGIPNPKTAGATGSIAFTTVGPSSYTIILEAYKGIPQS